MAAESARIVDAVAPEIQPPAEDEPPSMGAHTYDLGMCGPVTVDQASVRRVLPDIFKALATVAKNKRLELEEYEIDLGAPAVTGCINRYLPDFLKRTDSPELAMLLIFATAYGVRVGAGPLIEKIMIKFSSAPGTKTADSAESSRTSDSQEPEKPSGLAGPSPAPLA